jgi:hypothetical protein
LEFIDLGHVHFLKLFVFCFDLLNNLTVTLYLANRCLILLPLSSFYSINVLYIFC